MGSLVKRKPIVVEPCATISHAAKVMAENNVGSVLVVEGERLVGIFTERDLLRAVAAGRPLSTPVGELMSRELVTVSPGESIYKAMEIMTSRNIRHLPVVEGGRLVGVISIRDVAEWIRESLAEKVGEAEMGHFVA
ncbi:MAG: CBS domain-containing protein [Acidilobaceae archaeon]|nr:CBS domain-containing protein [Acidilobaceae archaeon]